jgi:hypothetical protein
MAKIQTTTLNADKDMEQVLLLLVEMQGSTF